jgi:hypothetical protein
MKDPCLLPWLAIGILAVEIMDFFFYRQSGLAAYGVGKLEYTAGDCERAAPYLSDLNKIFRLTFVPGLSETQVWVKDLLQQKDHTDVLEKTQAVLDDFPSPGAVGSAEDLAGNLGDGRRPAVLQLLLCSDAAAIASQWGEAVWAGGASGVQWEQQPKAQMYTGQLVARPSGGTLDRLFCLAPEGTDS